MNRPINPEGRPRCRCCGKNLVVRPRGLCCRCYYTPGVLDRFPLASEKARNGASSHHVTDHPSRPPAPTTAPPLTEAKTLVMTARAAAGEALHCQEDATLDLD
jgi:hypothetical protein